MQEVQGLQRSQLFQLQAVQLVDQGMDPVFNPCFSLGLVPGLEQARQKAKSHLGRLLSENAFRFHLPDNFESMTYGVSFEFTSMDEFKKQAQALTSLGDHPDLKGILQR